MNQSKVKTFNDLQQFVAKKQALKKNTVAKMEIGVVDIVRVTFRVKLSKKRRVAGTREESDIYE